MIAYRLLPHLALVLLLASPARLPGEQLPGDADKRIREYEAEAMRIRKKADAEIQSLQSKLLAELQILQGAASKAGKLDEALAIRGRIRQLAGATEYSRARPGETTTRKGFAAFLSADGRKLALWSREGAIRFINFVEVTHQGRNFTHPEYVQQLSLPGFRLFTLAFLAEDRSMAVVAGDTGEIYLWDFVSEGKPPITPLRPKQPKNGRGGAGRDTYLSFAISPDGKTVAGGSARARSRQEQILLWEANTGKPLHQWKLLRKLALQESGVCWVAFTLDGKRLVSASEDGTFCVWNVASGEEISRFKGTPISLERQLPITLAPDGRTLAQALPDHTIQMWGISAGEKRRLVRGPRKEIRALSLFPDGKTLAFGGGEGGMSLWDTTGGRQIEHFDYADLQTVAVSANGRVLMWMDNDHHFSWQDHRLGFRTGVDLPAMPRTGLGSAQAASEPRISEDQLPDDAVKRLKEFEAAAILKKTGAERRALRKKLVEDLLQLQDAHTRAGNLDDAVAIRDYLRQLTVVWEKARNLVVNGSFEEAPTLRFDDVHNINLEKGSTAIKGWVVTGGHVGVADPTYWQSADGERSLAIVGGEGAEVGGIRQDFATSKGQKYRVTFWMAGDTNGGPSEKKLRVSAAGKSAEFVFDTTGKDRKDMGWVSRSWEFTAEADRTTLEFSSLTEGMYGPALDHVAVVEVNE